MGFLAPRVCSYGDQLTFVGHMSGVRFTPIKIIVTVEGGSIVRKKPLKMEIRNREHFKVETED